MLWEDSSGTDLESLTYAYDAASNRTAKTNNLFAAFSETYQYDGLNRLTDTDRAGSDYQSWDLSATGNWDTVTTGGTTETRDYNNANEITEIDSDATATAYDPAGNMIKFVSAADDTKTHHAVYDAWNRLTAVYEDDGDGVAELGADDVLVLTNEYDGQKRRVQKVAGGDVIDQYFNQAWQLLETRVNSATNPQDQYVWDLRYIDTPAVRFYDAASDGQTATVPAPAVAVVFRFDCSECAECADASNSSQIQLDRESVSQVPAYGFSLRVPRVAVVKRVALILAVYCLLRTTRA